MKETVLISLSRAELESIVIGCVTSCLKVHNLSAKADEGESKYVTPEQGARLANCSRRKIDMAAADGKLTRHKVGARTLYLRSEVLKLVKPVTAA